MVYKGVIKLYKISDLRFKYPKNKEDTIKGISFEIREGEIFGLLGPSGVGKSTTQKLLIKLLTGYKGQVLYKGKDLNLYRDDYFEEIGVGFEMPVHFSKLTAEENLNFFKKIIFFYNWYGIAFKKSWTLWR